MPAELLLLTIARALVEVAGCFMLGQGLLYVFAGRKRNDNFVYQLFALLTRPVMQATRVITPRIVKDEHIPFAAFMLLLWLWIGSRRPSAIYVSARDLAWLKRFALQLLSMRHSCLQRLHCTRIQLLSGAATSEPPPSALPAPSTLRTP